MVRMMLVILTWNRWAPCRRVAGLRGATGLSVLQKWMLDSRGLGVNNRVGVWGDRWAAQVQCYSFESTPNNLFRYRENIWTKAIPPFYLRLIIMMILILEHTCLWILREWKITQPLQTMFKVNQCRKENPKKGKGKESGTLSGSLKLDLMIKFDLAGWGGTE